MPIKEFHFKHYISACADSEGKTSGEGGKRRGIKLGRKWEREMKSNKSKVMSGGEGHAGAGRRQTERVFRYNAVIAMSANQYQLTPNHIHQSHQMNAVSRSVKMGCSHNAAAAGCALFHLLHALHRLWWFIYLLPYLVMASLRRVSACSVQAQLVGERSHGDAQPHTLKLDCFSDVQGHCF